MDDEIKAIVKVVAPKFFEEGHSEVFVTQCCGRLLVSVDKAEKCQTCEGVPASVRVTKDEVDTWTTT